MTRTFASLLIATVMVVATQPAVLADQVLGVEGLRFHYDENTEPTARLLATRGTEALVRIENILGVSPGQPIDIFLAAGKSQFDALVPESVPDWAAGVAIPTRSEVILNTRAPNTTQLDLVRRFEHELVHVVVIRSTNGHPVSAWLTEGLAQIISGQSWWSRARILVPTGVLGRQIPLSDLTTSFPQNPHAAQNAYIQSMALVEWLEHTNEGSIAVILAEIGKGRSLDEALITAIGRNQASLEQEFFSHLGWDWGWLPLLGSSGTLWFAMTVMFIVAAMKRRRTKQEALARLAAEEASEAHRNPWHPPDGPEEVER